MIRRGDCKHACGFHSGERYFSLQWRARQKRRGLDRIEHRSMSGAVAKRDTGLGQVVWRYFDGHTVAISDLYEVLPHLARNMSKHLVAVLEFHAIHRRG